MSASQFRLGEEQAKEFARQLLMAHDVDAKQAGFVARNVVWNELVGRHNFGFERFDVYIKRLVAGGINPHANPRLKQNGEAVALIDGDNGFGQYAGAIGMRSAIKMAKQKGVGVVAVHNSNFFGTGAYFVEQAAKSSMIGLAMSNSFAKVAAHNGLLPVLGTNPFAFGAPRRHGQSLFIDIATSALAGSSVRPYAHPGRELPAGEIGEIYMRNENLPDFTYHLNDRKRRDAERNRERLENLAAEQREIAAEGERNDGSTRADLADIAARAVRQPFTFYFAASLIYLGITIISVVVQHRAEAWANRGVRRS